MENNFSKNLKKLRETKKISQQELAEKIGIDRSAISYWEAGKVDPTMGNVVKVAEVLNVDIISLIGDSLNFDNASLVDVSSDCVQIPVLGKIPAGLPFEAIENQYTIDYEEIPKDWLRGGKEYFALQLQGNSMEPDYHDKDVVILLKASTCESGQDCCIRINGFDATFKRVKKQENGIMIIPLNENNETGFSTTFYTKEDIENMPIEILGIAKQIRRNK